MDNSTTECYKTTYIFYSIVLISTLYTNGSRCLTVLNVYVNYYKPLTQTNTIHITHPANVFKGWTDDDNVIPHCWDSYLKKEKQQHLKIHTAHACTAVSPMYDVLASNQKAYNINTNNNFVIQCVQMIEKCSQRQ